MTKPSKYRGLEAKIRELLQEGDKVNTVRRDLLRKGYREKARRYRVKSLKHLEAAKGLKH